MSLLVPLALAACAAPSDRGAERVDVAAESAAEVAVPLDSVAPMRIVVLGNSIAAGYGLGRPREEAFPALVQARIDSLGWPFRVEAAAVSGSTTAGGVERIAGAVAGRGHGAAVGAGTGEVAVVVVELGGNDVMRLVPPDRTRRNLAEIVRQARAHDPRVRVLVAGLDLPGDIRHPLIDAYRGAFAAVADSASGVTFLPSLLNGVIGMRALNQRDGVHPNALGQERIAATLWPALRPLLEAALRDKGVASAALAAGAR